PLKLIGNRAAQRHHAVIRLYLNLLGLNIRVRADLCLDLAYDLRVVGRARARQAQAQRKHDQHSKHAQGNVRLHICAPVFRAVTHSMQSCSFAIARAGIFDCIYKPATYRKVALYEPPSVPWLEVRAVGHLIPKAVLTQIGCSPENARSSSMSARLRRLQLSPFLRGTL